MARFFETEGVAVLTLLALRYQIKVKEEPQFAGETFEEMSARLVDSKYGMTLTSVFSYLQCRTIIYCLYPLDLSEFLLFSYHEQINGQPAIAGTYHIDLFVPDMIR